VPAVLEGFDSCLVPAVDDAGDPAERVAEDAGGLPLGFPLHDQVDRMEACPGDGVSLRMEELADLLQGGVGGNAGAAHG